MKRILLCLVLASLVPVTIGAETLLLQSDAKLVVPTSPIQAGQLVQIFVNGLSESQLNKAIVDWEPQDNVLVIPAKTWGDQPMILFQPPAKNAAKSYAIWIAYPIEGGQVTQGYLKGRVLVGDVNPPTPPEPPLPPKPVNPHSVPDSAWLKTLMPLSEAAKTSALPFLKAKQAGERLESLAAQVQAGALRDSAQLFRAISQAGSGASLGKEVAEAMGSVMETQNPHDKPVDMGLAAWTLKYMAWALWENSVMESK